MNSSLTDTQRDKLALKGVPITAFEYVTVTFPATPNTDYDIAHTLLPANPERIDYEVVKRDRACGVYNDQSGTRRKWQAGYITLRCDTASAVVDLRLSVRRE